MTAPIALHAHVEGQGPELLLLHGLFGSARNWLGLQRELARTFRVHALDLRNHGQSPWSESMSYESMAADVSAYIQSHCHGLPTVLGHSMGGKVAMTLALQAAVPIAALIVVDIAPVDNPPTLSPVLAAMLRVDPSSTNRRQQVGEWLAPAVPDERVRAFLLQNLVSRDGGLQWRIHLQAIARAMPAIPGFPQPLQSRRYDGPCRFIIGADSDYVRSEHHPLIRRLFPRAAIDEIAGAGHWVHADQAQAFLASVREALGGP
ncbi:MAG: alpha/beta fold hydrolase [Burkholderiaceae bacterium]